MRVTACYTAPHESRRSRRGYCQATAGSTRPLPPLVQRFRGGPHRPRRGAAARLALERIGNSAALYHTVEHTMLVTLVGYDIMKGRSLLASTSASDYAHLIAACLFHDIGFVRGILTGDGEDGYVIDADGGKVKLPRGSSDAALMPYHVERSKLFVMD